MQLKILKEKEYTFVCQFVGGETSEMGAVQFSEEVDKRNLNDRIAYVGRKVGEEKEAFFRQSDVFVFQPIIIMNVSLWSFWKPWNITAGHFHQ